MTRISSGRNAGRSQRVRVGRGHARVYPRTADDGLRLLSSTTMASPRSAAGPTSSASRSTDIRAFYRRSTTGPDNAMLIITGRFDAAKALDEAVKKRSGPWSSPSTSPSTRPTTEEPPQDGERSVTLRTGRRSSARSACFITSRAGSHPDFAAVQVMAEMLGASPSGRLQVSAGRFGQGDERAGLGLGPPHDPGGVDPDRCQGRAREVDEMTFVGRCSTSSNR